MIPVNQVKLTGKSTLIMSDHAKWFGWLGDTLDDIIPSCLVAEQSGLCDRREHSPVFDP